MAVLKYSFEGNLHIPTSSDFKADFKGLFLSVIDMDIEVVNKSDKYVAYVCPTVP